MVGTAIDALGGGVGADAIDLLRNGWLCKALVAWVGSGCVRGVAADAAALGVDFRVASSWVAEAPTEGALDGRSS